MRTGPILLAMLLMWGSQPARADKFKCTAASKIARLGAPNGMIVSVTSDDDERECRFSVAGEPAGSPPKELIQPALINARNGALGMMVERGEYKQLGYLLLAAAPERDIPRRSASCFWVRPSNSVSVRAWP